MEEEPPVLDHALEVSVLVQLVRGLVVVLLGPLVDLFAAPAFRLFGSSRGGDTGPRADRARGASSIENLVSSPCLVRDLGGCRQADAAVQVDEAGILAQSIEPAVDIQVP